MRNTIQCGSYILDFKKTVLMGIINVTPDSFYHATRTQSIEEAVAYAQKMIQEGADIIDVGAESTRPGSDPISVDEELSRIIPVVKRLVEECSVPISVDTYKPKVAESCLKVGAHIINDITGLTNSDMRKVVAQYDVPVVLMHMQGTPKNMQQNPVYTDVVAEIKLFFMKQIEKAQSSGIQKIILDPGIGFGKTVTHNLNILKRLQEFQDLGFPILVGPSRKSFIGTITGLPVEQRLEGTIAAVVIACMHGAHIVRVHDIAACKHAVQIVDALRGV
ncbi:MAG: dihydropteroate synthase [Candidatus Thermoplasmatota archaeon]